jgi:hypothetical protein
MLTYIVLYLAFHKQKFIWGIIANCHIQIDFIFKNKLLNILLYRHPESIS